MLLAGVVHLRLVSRDTCLSLLRGLCSQPSSDASPTMVLTTFKLEKISPPMGTRRQVGRRGRAAEDPLTEDVVVGVATSVRAMGDGDLENSSSRRSEC